jgi:hypothetical protein
MFVVDYWAIYGLLDTLESVNAGCDRVMHAGRCVMFRYVCLRAVFFKQSAHAAAAATCRGVGFAEGVACCVSSAVVHVFEVDFWALYCLLDTLESVNAGCDRVMHAGRCVMFRYALVLPELGDPVAGTGRHVKCTRIRL